MVLFRHNHLQLTQAQLTRGEFPKLLSIEEGVVLSSTSAEWKVRRAPGVLLMAVVSQSSVKFGKKHVFLVGTINSMTSVLCLYKGVCQLTTALFSCYLCAG